jgi:hypothetical protein
MPDQNIGVDPNHGRAPLWRIAAFMAANVTGRRGFGIRPLSVVTSEVAGQMVICPLARQEIQCDPLFELAIVLGFLWEW